MANCLVCGKPVDEHNWLASGADKALWEGKTYWFCGLPHKQRFINNREQFLAQEQAQS